MQVLDHPQPPALVEAQAHRLTNDGLGQNQVDLQIVGNVKRRERLLGTEPGLRRRVRRGPAWS